jgi:hypothetical protein
MLKSIDLIGNQIGIMKDGHYKNKSVFGGILTIILSFLSLSAFINFGLQIVEKKNPKVMTGNLFELSPFLNLSKNFPLIVNVIQRGAIPLDDFQTYYNITMVNFYQTMENGIPKKVLTPMKMRICQEEDFLNQKKDFLSVANPSNSLYYFCLPQDQIIQLWGSIGTSDNNYLALLINKCQNGTDIICKSDSIITSKFSNMFVQLLVRDFYFDHNNNTNAEQKYLKAINIPISSDFYKRAYLYFRNVDYNTDNGLIFESFETKTFYQLDSFKEVIFFSKSAAFYPYTLAEISLTMAPLKMILTRNYYKVQNLAADVGGIVKIFTMILSFFNEFIMRKYLNFELVSGFININRNFYKKNLKNKINQNLKSEHTNKDIVSRNKPFESDKNYKSILFNTFTKNAVSPKKIYVKSNKFKFNFKNWMCRKKNEVLIVEYSNQVIKQAMDLKIYLKNLNEFNCLKKIMFSTHQKNVYYYLSYEKFHVSHEIEPKLGNINVSVQEIRKNPLDIISKNLETEIKIL